MIKVGQIWKRIGDTWTEQYKGSFILITLVKNDYAHFRYPYWDMVGHCDGIYQTERFTQHFELVEDT